MKMTNALDTVKLEVALMKKLDHPNLCKMIEVIDDDGHQRLYMGKSSSDADESCTFRPKNCQ